jgi:formamidopyrimidine-DNA glycosylase
LCPRMVAGYDRLLPISPALERRGKAFGGRTTLHGTSEISAALCVLCGSKTRPRAEGIRRIVQGGRSTFYCPRTQR